MGAGHALRHQREALGGLNQAIERGAECRDLPAQVSLGGRVALVAVQLHQLHGEAGQELELDAEAHQRLEIGHRVRGRLVELGVDEIDAPIDEDLLPRHEDVVEDHGDVQLVEARRERIVVDARGLGGERPARIELEAVDVDRDDERQRVIVVAWDQRRDVGEE